MFGGLALLWQIIDGRLRQWSETLQRIVRMLRLARALLWIAIVLVLASAAVQVWAPAYFPYAYAIAVLFLSLPLILLAMLIGLPLRAKSVVRLIDMGYPANGKEVLIRVLARKLRDESIETEELLVETAVNEAKKLMRRMKEREDDIDGDIEDEGPEDETRAGSTGGAGSPPS